MRQACFYIPAVRFDFSVRHGNAGFAICLVVIKDHRETAGFSAAKTLQDTG
jgi:hypothetical protein